MMTIMLILGAALVMLLLSVSRYNDYDRYDRYSRRPQRTVVYNDSYDDEWRYRRYRAEESSRSLMFTFIFVGLIAFLMYAFNENNSIVVEPQQTTASHRITQSR